MNDKKDKTPWQDVADWVDSHILFDYLKQAGKILDDKEVPLIGRWYWDPEKQKILKGGE